MLWNFIHANLVYPHLVAYDNLQQHTHGQNNFVREMEYLSKVDKYTSAALSK